MARLLCVAIAALAGSARALTIQEPFQVQGSYPGPLTSFASTGVSFSTNLIAAGGQQVDPVVGILFTSRVLTPADAGTTLWADASDGAGFADAAESLTNGYDGEVTIAFPWIPFQFGMYHTAAAEEEAKIFADDPLATGAPDLHGMRIDRLGFRLDQLVLDGATIPGTTEVTLDATLSFEGERVPEPSPGALAALALGALALGRWRPPNRARALR